MVRDYKQAAADLQRLVCLLEKQCQQKSKESGSGNEKELRQVQQRLSMMEEEAKKEVPVDLYLILGIKKSNPASEIKKAYRKAGLRHHPAKREEYDLAEDMRKVLKESNNVRCTSGGYSDYFYRPTRLKGAAIGDIGRTLAGLTTAHTDDGEAFGEAYWFNVFGHWPLAGSHHQSKLLATSFSPNTFNCSMSNNYHLEAIGITMAPVMS
ncbi:LOW QUALITY PROTEIN: hypothetical protein Cgig2_027879 [Carnegiea gigantea]|uniref:J domain-containing protein n=1 Tax=Carnegiea gigantea TaxID=171969 RepID=A0A9Q1QKA1_9CARY|nr:LOW QUALITY PROTEIN: hypothetical protein Cgig2_027879 [Carnegiea gigantea]